MQILSPDNDEPLLNLVREFHSKNLKVPSLQRGKVWTTEHLRALLESISRGFPLGTVFLWDMTNPLDNNSTYEDEIDISSYILDGQQRISSLAALLFEEERKITPKIKLDTLFYDPIGNSFYIKLRNTKIPEHFVCVTKFTDGNGVFNKYDFWVGMFEKSSKISHPKILAQNVVDMIEKIRQQKIIKIVARTTAYNKQDLADIAKLFIAINRSGKLLTTNEVTMASIMGRIRSIDSSLNKTLQTIAKHRLFAGKPLSPAQLEKHKEWILGLLSAFCFNGAKYHTRQNPALLQLDEIPAIGKHFINVNESIKIMLDSLVENGIDDPESIPHFSFLAVTSYLLYKFKNEPVDSTKIKAIKRYIYVGVLSQYFALNNAEVCINIIKQSNNFEDASKSIIDNHILKNNVRVEPFLPLTADLIRQAKQSQRFAKSLKTVTIAISSLEDWATGATLNRSNNSSTYRVEEHHIFPKACLKSMNITETSDRDCLANIAFVTGHTNNVIINDNWPEEYLPKIQKKHLTAQFIPDIYWNADDFYDFLDKRSELWADSLNESLSLLPHRI